MSLERRIKKGRYCPRGCGRQLLSNGYNPKSKRDGNQICADCFVDENLAIFLNRSVQKSLDKD